MSPSATPSDTELREFVVKAERASRVGNLQPLLLVRYTGETHFGQAPMPMLEPGMNAEQVAELLRNFTLLLRQNPAEAVQMGLDDAFVGVLMLSRTLVTGRPQRHDLEQPMAVSKSRLTLRDGSAYVALFNLRTEQLVVAHEPADAPTGKRLAAVEREFMLAVDWALTTHH